MPGRKREALIEGRCKYLFGDKKIFTPDECVEAVLASVA